MMTTVAKTENVGLATYWLARGLTLREANSYASQCGHVVFEFEDPRGIERQLTEEFHRNVRVRVRDILQARSDLARALWLAKNLPARRCSGVELRHELNARRSAGRLVQPSLPRALPR